MVSPSGRGAFLRKRDSEQLARDTRVVKAGRRAHSFHNARRALQRVVNAPRCDAHLRSIENAVDNG